MLHITQDKPQIVEEHPVLTLIQHKAAAVVVAHVVAPRRRAVVLVAIPTSIIIIVVRIATVGIAQ